MSSPVTTSELRDAIADAIAPLATQQALSDAVAPLATKHELADAVAPLATKQELAGAVAPLATKQELADAVAPLATKQELADAVAPLATKQELADRLADAVAPLATKADIEARFATKTELDLWGGALLARMQEMFAEQTAAMHEAIARALRASQEYFTGLARVLDDKYRDLPPRVTRLEAKVFPPQRTRRSATPRRRRR
jgi:hypothetical protein